MNLRLAPVVLLALVCVALGCPDSSSNAGDCRPPCGDYAVCTTVGSIPTCLCVWGLASDGVTCLPFGDAGVDAMGPDSGIDPDAGVAGPAKLFLRSSSTGTDIVYIGAGNPSSEPVPFVTGTVDHDSSTSLFLGTVTLNGSGAGTFEVAASYSFPYQPGLSVAARDGSQRTDFATPIPLAVQVTYQPSSAVDITVDGTQHTYTPYPNVVAAVNLAGPMGTLDTFQLYNLGVFFSQARIPAFGSIGMTRYIAQPGQFLGLTTGDYTVSVASIANPKATISYLQLEDFPGQTFDGSIVSDVNISGSGTMNGVVTFRIVGGTMASPIIYEGSVDYAGISVTNGMPSSGSYALTVTAPTSTTGSVAYSYASAIDLRNILPEAP